MKPFLGMLVLALVVTTGCGAALSSTSSRGPSGGGGSTPAPGWNSSREIVERPARVARERNVVSRETSARIERTHCNPRVCDPVR